MIAYTIERASEVPSDLWAYTDHRITRETKRAFTELEGGRNRIIMVARSVGPYFVNIGVAGVVSTNENEGAYYKGMIRWAYAFVIVAPSYRGLGIGTALLNRRLLEQAKLYPHLVRESFVASDNAASVRMCEKASLLLMGEKQGARESGPFVQYRFIDSEVI